MSNSDNRHCVDDNAHLGGRLDLLAPAQLTPDQVWLRDRLTSTRIARAEARFGFEQLGRKRRDSLADVEESDAYGIEAQPVRQVAAFDVRDYRLDSRRDLAKTLPVSVAHSGIRSTSIRRRRSGFNPSEGITSTCASRSSSACARRPMSTDRIIGQINEQIDVAVCPLLTTRDGVEDTNV